jgi:polygalacturonase
VSIKPPDSATLPTSSFVQVLREAPLNVQYPEYGAKGDDATNDSAALNAASTAASAVSKGSVYLPSGYV